MKKFLDNFEKYSVVYLVAILIITMFAVSFAVYVVTRRSSNNVISTGRISMSYIEPSNAYILENALPMSDSIGKKISNYFEFMITSHATTNVFDNTGLIIPYEINLLELTVDKDKIPLSKNQIKVYVTRVENGIEKEIMEPVLLSNLVYSKEDEESVIAYTAKDIHKNAGDEINTKYRLRAWISDDVEASNFKNNVYQYKFNVNVNSNVNALGKVLLKDTIIKEGIVTNKDGLYVSTDTLNGAPTYYYRGDVENNYVLLANELFRIVRINEDGTIRLILDKGINNDSDLKFNSNFNDYRYMYYSNSNENGAMKMLEDWYDDKLSKYDNIIVTTTYCEETRVKGDDSFTANNVLMSSKDKYKISFNCENDLNGKGVINSKVGLISFDEVSFSNNVNGLSYLYNDAPFWTMSPAGYGEINGIVGSSVWYANNGLSYKLVNEPNVALRPVISVKADSIQITGNGSYDFPYEIK